MEQFLIPFTREELETNIEALATCKILSPRKSTVTEASLCKRLNDIKNNPFKGHPFSQPRLQPWIADRLK